MSTLMILDKFQRLLSAKEIGEIERGNLKWEIMRGIRSLSDTELDKGLMKAVNITQDRTQKKRRDEQQIVVDAIT